MGQSDVHAALRQLVRLLETDDIPYAIVGGMALNEYGYQRVTVDVDVLLTSADLDRFKAEHLGRGYSEKLKGSRGFRDTLNRVDIDVLLAGDFPGDGKPKPVAFPDPKDVAERGKEVRLLPMPRFLELKLASGMTAPHRLQDLADVLALIRTLGLSRDFASNLNSYVQEKYLELWAAAQVQEA